jgi:SAM-dependent methyltransferase
MISGTALEALERHPPLDIESDLVVYRYDWRQALSRSVLVPWRRRYVRNRATFILNELGGYLEGRVLDVGSGSNAKEFRERLGQAFHAVDLEASYTLGACDAGLRPDTVVDLEQAPLPFPSGSFETVICTETLEHLQNIYQTFDELFRVSRRFVIISLPNNWPLMGWSFLIGHNVTHRSGYGLPPQPKVRGQGHQHFFNLEEACDFLFGRMPAGFVVSRFETLFEYVNDGVLVGAASALSPRVVNLLMSAGGLTLKRSTEKLGLLAGLGLWMLRQVTYVPLSVADAIVSSLLWGWGSRVRFYNLFCKQVVVVFERVN